ncbi:hypothetical protein G2W53_025171 [Senna tora]|uniref:Uncharacterized protein n=1 Tax=Senna tora TaxID=362788 RepID=A0A834TEE7_9FABA|nr:hypothetical protein G2W53_025171 [Senna tora]
MFNFTSCRIEFHTSNSPSLPLPINPYILLRELPIRQHRRQQVLRLRRDQREARHPSSRRHHLVVVRIYGAHPEAREAQVLGEAVHNVDSLRVLVAAGLEDLRHAGELARGEGGTRVDLVGYQMDVLHASYLRVEGLRVLIRRLHRVRSDLEVVGAVAVDWDYFHPGSPTQGVGTSKASPGLARMKVKSSLAAVAPAVRTILSGWKVARPPLICCMKEAIAVRKDLRPW